MSLVALQSRIFSTGVPRQLGGDEKLNESTKPFRILGIGYHFLQKKKKTPTKNWNVPLAHPLKNSYGNASHTGILWNLKSESISIEKEDNGPDLQFYDLI
jgi:hypothetical protein